MPFEITFSESDSFDISFGSDSGFAVEFENTVEVPVGEFYEGDYTVIPKAHEAQVLPTRMLIMADDLTVTKVPYFQTSNVYGDTVYIASEV